MKPRLLVLADIDLLPQWTAGLLQRGFEIKRCSTPADLRADLAGNAGVILVRLRDARDLLGLMRNLPAPLILIQPKESPDLAAVARANGVANYLREPISSEELLLSVDTALRGGPQRKRLESGDNELVGAERLVGGGAGMRAVRSSLANIAATDCNTVIAGETGTGKELAAELLHINSRRRNQSFICINCAAIPETLLESELFGYEKGAFTGAEISRQGRLEWASGGTLFLDEIGELSLASQAKILRAIEGKEVQRLGRRTGVKVDVRIICATNRDLEAEVKRGTFRADLFFRLNVARLDLPPLRDRKEDLPELVEHFVQQLNSRMGRQACGFTEYSWHSMLRHDWPGNVRELRNIVETCLVHLPYSHMRLMELPEEFHRRFTQQPSTSSESEQLLTALVTHNWNKSQAAKHLQWSRMRLYRKMAEYQLSAGEKSKARSA